MVYHVVTSSDGIIMAVFASKEEDKAIRHARMMSRPGTSFWVDTVRRSKRPQLGGRL